MAKIKVDAFVSQLETEFKKALTSTIYKELGDIEFNTKDLFNTFKKELVDKCDTWETLPNKHIKN